MSAFLDPVLHFSPVWLLVVCTALVFLEDAIFVGFVLPGETAAVIAGVSTALGHLSLPLVILCVVLAAIVGDSVGYEVGKRWFGPALLRFRFLQRHQDRITKAQDYLRAKGGLAVFLGRFTAFFRAMMPALAGASHMPYRRFLAWNALGGIVWGTAFVLLGNLAGASYHHVEKYVGRGFAGAAVVVVVVLLAWHHFRKEKSAEHVGDAR